MERNEKEAFLRLLDKFIAEKPSHFFVSVPVTEHSLLDDFPRLVFVESGEVDCDVGVNGTIRKVHLPYHSVLYGMKGASTGCSDRTSCNGNTITIGFFENYIRFVYYRFKEGKSVDFFFCHTPEPLSSSGCMILEALRSIALNPELNEVKFDLIKALLKLSKYQLQNPCTKKMGKAAVTWKKIEAFIEQHFMEESFSRKTIAKEFLLNESYLSTLCQTNTNHTLHNFILLRKLSYSLLLLEQNMTIGEIAMQCGFNQTGYFIQVFRKVYGVSPGKYRTNVWQNSNGNQRNR